MLYHHLFSKMRKKDMVTAAVIGAGHFGTAIVTQQSHASYLRVSIVADTNLDLAREAFIKAGIPESEITYCADPDEAAKIIAAGKYVYTDNALMIMEVPQIDVVAEATGVPEAAVRHCKSAIENKKHVTAISKEMDSVVGPYLRRLAIENGVTYSPVDGDQPALLMAMVEWARLIGLRVLSAGKARDGEFILDEKNRTVSIAADGITVHHDACVTIPENQMKYFEMIPDSPGASIEYLARREEVLRDLPNAGDFDLCELVMIANATGLAPQKPETMKATLRITELPVAYCEKKYNGIYDNEGIVDVHTNLRRRDESGMGGGVYMVVCCDNAYSNYILTTKGQIPNYDCSTAVIYRPYHLCGVEVTTTLLSQGLLGLDTGAMDYLPSFDLVKVAARDIKKGEIIGNDHDDKLTALILPAAKMAADSPIPGHMANGNAASVDIKKGQIITYSMIERPKNSTLWELREKQDEMFL